MKNIFKPSFQTFCSVENVSYLTLKLCLFWFGSQCVSAGPWVNKVLNPLGVTIPLSVSL